LRPYPPRQFSYRALTWFVRTWIAAQVLLNVLLLFMLLNTDEALSILHSFHVAIPSDSTIVLWNVVNLIAMIPPLGALLLRGRLSQRKLRGR